MPSAERISMEEAMMRCAEVLAQRSTCARNQVGALVTDPDGYQVLGIGYNGNARGLPNQCDQADPPCGCIHAEINAFLKAPGVQQGKLLFTTVSPCVACAKAAINAGIARVYYRTQYRDVHGIATLLAAKVHVIQLVSSGTVRIIRDTRQLKSDL